MRPEPAFSDPWHAQIFALTVHLNESGNLPWPDWAEAFGATLKKHGLAKDLNGGDDYFNAWLETLEKVLAQRGLAEPADLVALKDAWAEAFLTTPHGSPVHLTDKA